MPAGPENGVFEGGLEQSAGRKRVSDVPRRVFSFLDTAEQKPASASSQMRLETL